MTSALPPSVSRGTGKICTLAEAINLIRDGDMVAVGGHAAQNHPMALVREIIRQGRRRLHAVGWSGGLDLELLAGAGCLAVVETSAAGLGDRPPMVTDGGIRVIGHDEEIALARFRAAAAGLPLMPLRDGLAAVSLAGDFAGDPHVKPFTDPFTGERRLAVEAVRPDVAILHAHAADARGNVQMDEATWLDTPPDLLIARSARTVIVSVEQIVSEQTVASRPNLTVLPGDQVTCVVEAPYGAHPGGCDGRYGTDADQIRRYREAAATPEGVAAYLEATVHRPAGHTAYLDTVGMRRLMDISRRRTHYA